MYTELNNLYRQIFSIEGDTHNGGYIGLDLPSVLGMRSQITVQGISWLLLLHLEVLLSRKPIVRRGPQRASGLLVTFSPLLLIAIRERKTVHTCFSLPNSLSSRAFVVCHNKRSYTLVLVTPQPMAIGPMNLQQSCQFMFRCSSEGGN